MEKINYEKARKMLARACERYVKYNETQLDQLLGKSYYTPRFWFFIEALSKKEPAPGFQDWVRCEYYGMLQYILRLGWSYMDTIGLYYASKFPFPRLKLRKTPSEELDPDQQDPNLVLNNITALSEILKYIMVEENKEPQFIEKLAKHREQTGCNYNISKDAPLSLQIDDALKNLKSLIDFINTTAITTLHKDEWRQGSLRRRLEVTYPTFEDYIKGIVVKELKATLDNPNLSDEEALKAAESQLSNATTREILTKNVQSHTEHQLKLLSVISILIGVGIFTTLGLMIKRLYDTGGTSANFFKPLSQNLYEDAENIIHVAKPSAP